MIPGRGLFLASWPTFIYAQVAASDDFTKLATLVTQIGLSSIFLWQWRDERRERRDLQAALNQLTAAFGGAVKDVVETLEKVQSSMASTVQRVNDTPDRRDLDLSIRRLELLTDELTRRRRRGDEE